MARGLEQTRYQHTSSLGKRLLQQGESSAVEYKSMMSGVKPRVIAALANLVAVHPEYEVAHLLVGVAELEDKETGLVVGTPAGLEEGLDNTVISLLNLAKEVKPIPPKIMVIEEDVSGPKPWVRMEIRPTTAPHFDGEGRRQIRNGRSTRALTDEELLNLYLQRESNAFAQRYQQTTSEMEQRLGAINTQIESLLEQIDEKLVKSIDGLQNLEQNPRNS